MITFTFDLQAGWTFDGDPASAFGVRFSDGDATRLYPDGLAFGWTCGDVTHEWPAANAVVREITPQRTFEFRLDVKPDDEITLDVWAENAGVRVEGETTWTVPRPAQPFGSWTWTDGAWTAPKPYPEGDGWYEWDEDAEAWVERELIDGG
jgi:hypothetical protein